MRKIYDGMFSINEDECPCIEDEFSEEKYNDGFAIRRKRYFHFSPDCDCERMLISDRHIVLCATEDEAKYIIENHLK